MIITLEFTIVNQVQKVYSILFDGHYKPRT